METSRGRTLPNGRRYLRVVLQLAVSLGLLTLLFSRIEWQRVAQLLRNADFGLLLLLLGVYAADRVLMALKWRQLLRVLDPRLGPLGAVRVYYESSFVGFAMPLGGLGPDIVRYVRLLRLGIEPHVTLVSMIMERIVGLIATLAVAGIGLAVLASLTTGTALGNFARIASVVSVAAAVGSGFVIFHPHTLGGLAWLLERFRRLRDKVAKHVTAARAYAERRLLLLANLALSALEQTVPVWTYWIGSRALDMPLPLVVCLAVAPVTVVIQRLPIAYGGLGLREGSAAALLVALGYDYSEALVLAMTLFVMFIVSLLPGAVIFKRSRPLASRAGGELEAGS